MLISVEHEICPAHKCQNASNYIYEQENSTQLCMKFFLLINVEVPTVVGILTFMNRKNSIIRLSEPKKC